MCIVIIVIYTCRTEVDLTYRHEYAVASKLNVKCNKSLNIRRNYEVLSEYSIKIMSRTSNFCAKSNCYYISQFWRIVARNFWFSTTLFGWENGFSSWDVESLFVIVVMWYLLWRQNDVNDMLASHSTLPHLEWVCMSRRWNVRHNFIHELHNVFNKPLRVGVVSVLTTTTTTTTTTVSRKEKSHAPKDESHQ